MDFNDTPHEAAFRQEARTWIAANAPSHLEPELKQSSFGNSGLRSEDPIKAAKDWQKKKYEGGWACLHWPKAYGGRGASPIERVIWGQEEGAYGQLSGLFTIGHGMCGPTVMAWAKEEQKRELLPRLASGEDVWCQLFSEPAGGSDRALEMGRDYALDRMAFGRPIGSFQAVKHMLADMYVAATLARSNAYYGAWALSTGSAELPMAAATARVSATQAFQQCAKNNIQVHGGMGFTWAFDCHLYYRRSNALALALGSLSTWEDMLIERMRLRNAVAA